jgi:hypothetical protein
VRVQMLTSKAVEKEGGARRVYQGGRFYVLPTKEARTLIAAGEAIDPDNPPAPEQVLGAEPAVEKGDDA